MKSEIYDYDERLERYRRIIAGFGRNGELPSGTWISSPAGDDITETNNMIEYGKGLVGQKIAYFSMEIALLNNVHTYSGGLGVLAGDVVKSGADLKIPLKQNGLPQSRHR
ncbi:MAG: hypothetical protein QXN24_07440 [Candidatus Bathyarchaeia archaeon]